MNLGRRGYHPTSTYAYLEEYMWKVFSVLIMIIMLVPMVTINADAYATNDEGLSTEEAVKRVDLWNQGSSEIINPNDPGCNSFQQAGCSSYSMAYALVKMGLIDPSDGTGISSLMDKARNKNCFHPSVPYYFYYNNINELYSDIEYCGRGDVDTSSLSIDEALTYIKELMNEDYYVVGVVVVSGTGINHCIFFDGVNADGTLSIGDSGYLGTTWEDYYGTFDESLVTISYVELMKNDSKPFSDQPSIYDDNALRSGSAAVNGESLEHSAYLQLVEEWQLRGMPREQILTDFAAETILADVSGLNQAELNSLQAIKSNKDASKLSLQRILNISLMVLGICIIIYSVLLMLSYLFDRVNSFSDISLVKIMSFGGICIADEDSISFLDSESVRKRRYITAGKLFLICIILMVIGAGLISGNLVNFVYSVIYRWV